MKHPFVGICHPRKVEGQLPCGPLFSPTRVWQWELRGHLCLANSGKCTLPGVYSSAINASGGGMGLCGVQQRLIRARETCDWKGLELRLLALWV